MRTKLLSGLYGNSKRNKISLCRKITWHSQCLLLALLLVAGQLSAAPDPDSLLQSRGFSVIPTPQSVQLSTELIVIDGSWELSDRNSGSQIARVTLEDHMKGSGIIFSKTSGKKIVLEVVPGAVKGSRDAALNREGYRLQVSKELVKITGNSKAGLFYGVQTFNQMIRKNDQGQWILPMGEIRDWPNLQIRMIHWDTKNHLDRISSLKKDIDRLARLKVNAISFEIWDKFRFPTDPDIGVKEGFTPAQLQDLVNYGLERYIQIVPNVQAPAHMQWVLKHPKYAHLRADGSDYQACMCDPETNKLIFSLYQDLIDATKGVDYLHASTDEVYYAGICKKCKPYNEENRSMAFVDFVNSAHAYLKKQNRRMIFWGEWPLAPEHIRLLPADIIEGVLGSSYFVGRIEPITEEGYISEENKRGIRQLVYTSQTASLAPINFGVSRGQNMENLHKWFSVKAKRGNPIGSFGAGWDDLGPHSELYWLGWTAVSSFSWNSDAPKNPERFVARFMADFYGPLVSGMVDIYRDMDLLANFWNRSWEKIVKEVPGTGSTRASYGNSFGKYAFPRPLSQPYLPAPALPFTDGLNVRPVYYNGYKQELVTEAKKIEELATAIIYRLEENRLKAVKNDYNLRVLLTLTRYMRHHARLFLNMEQIEKHLQTAEQKAALGDAKAAVEALLFANAVAKSNRYESKECIEDMKTVYSETRVPGYLTLEDLYFGAEQSIGIDGWIESINQVILQYAGKHGLTLAPIKDILNKGAYTGENTGE